MDNRYQQGRQGRRDFGLRQEEQFQPEQGQFDDGDTALLDRDRYASAGDGYGHGYDRTTSYGRSSSHERSPTYGDGYASETMGRAPNIDRDRGMLDRAGDEVRSWFGDDAAARRRKLDERYGDDNYGKGPSGYTRSNERLLEDACERLTSDRVVDATGISVTCDNNEITLDGTVNSRRAKRRAEDIVHDIAGIKHVQNNLRILDDASTRRVTDAD